MKMSFEMALANLKRGSKMRRVSWETGLYLKLSRGELNFYCDGKLMEIELDRYQEESLTFDDILAEDWVIYK